LGKYPKRRVLGLAGRQGKHRSLAVKTLDLVASQDGAVDEPVPEVEWER
jgi:hypothetical protein